MNALESAAARERKDRRARRAVLLSMMFSNREVHKSEARENFNL